MKEITLELLNEFIADSDATNENDLSTFIDALNDYRDVLDINETDSIVEYMGEYLSIDSDAELSDITDYEKDDLVEFIKNI